MLRSVDGSFRTVKVLQRGIGPANLTDTTPGAVNGGWTTGATIVDRVDYQQTRGGHIHAFAVTAALAVSFSTGNAYGKLGKIQAGILVKGDVTPTPPANLGNTAQFTPPPAAPFLADLWDPAIHPLPPIAQSTGVGGSLVPPFLWMSVDKSLSQVVPIYPGGILCIGIWVHPSLLSGDGIGQNNPIPVVLSATYSITIDQDPIDSG